MHRVALLFVLLVVFPFSLFAQENVEKAEADVGALIEALGGVEYADREAAEEALWKLGIKAIPALRRATGVDDPEVSERAKLVLERIAGGEVDGWDETLGEKLEALKNENSSSKRAKLVRELIEMPGGGLATEHFLRVGCTGEQLRSVLRYLSPSSKRKLIQQWIAEGRFQSAHDLLLHLVAASTESSITDYVAFLQINGRLGDVLKITDGKKQKSLRLLRGWALRADGRVAEALEIAEAFPSSSLGHSLRLDARDWEGLATTFTSKNIVEQLGYQAFFWKRAGNGKDYQKAVDQLVERAKDEPEDRVSAAQTLMLLDEVDLTLKVLDELDDLLALQWYYGLNECDSVMKLAKRIEAEGEGDQGKALSVYTNEIMGIRERNEPRGAAPEKIFPEKKAPAVFDLVEKARKAEEAGKNDEAAELWHQAETWFLSDGSARLEGLGWLKANEPDEVVQAWIDDQIEWGERWMAFGDSYAGQFARGMSIPKAIKEKDFAKADFYNESQRMRILAQGVHYIRETSYLNVAWNGATYRILAALENDDAAEAERIMKQWKRFIPKYGSDFCEDLVERGYQDAADKIFEVAYDGLKTQADAFPKYAMIQNNLAWNIALSKKRLEEGLAYSTKALELAPKEPAYLDTMAELLFLNGETEKAIEMEKRALEIRDDDFFRRQIERFKGGDTMSMPK